MSMKFKDVANLYLPFLAMVDDRSYMVHGYSMYEDMFCIDIDETTQDWWNTSNFKPILRLVKDMTDEQKRELYQLVFNKNFGVNGDIRFYDSLAKDSKPGDISRWVLWSGVERLGIQLDGNIWADSDLQKWKFNKHEITRWFLIKGFDLFGLIESGEAKNVESLASSQIGN